MTAEQLPVIEHSRARGVKTSLAHSELKTERSPDGLIAHATYTWDLIAEPQQVAFVAPLGLDYWDPLEHRPKKAGLPGLRLEPVPADSEAIATALMQEAQDRRRPVKCHRPYFDRYHLSAICRTGGGVVDDPIADTCGSSSSGCHVRGVSGTTLQVDGSVVGRLGLVEGNVRPPKRQPPCVVGPVVRNIGECGDQRLKPFYLMRLGFLEDSARSDSSTELYSFWYRLIAD